VVRANRFCGEILSRNRFFAGRICCFWGKKSPSSFSTIAQDTEKRHGIAIFGVNKFSKTKNQRKPEKKTEKRRFQEVVLKICRKTLVFRF
jgi:hypothetical protein